jgi:hypothetical protein
MGDTFSKQLAHKYNQNDVIADMKNKNERYNTAKQYYQ